MLPAILKKFPTWAPDILSFRRKKRGIMWNIWHSNNSSSVNSPPRHAVSLATMFHHTGSIHINICLVQCSVLPVFLPIAMGAYRVETKSRHLIHMTLDMAVLPAEPRRSCGELFLSQLSLSVTIQACKWAHREDLFIWMPLCITCICIMYIQWLYTITSSGNTHTHRDCFYTPAASEKFTKCSWCRTKNNIQN